MAGADDGAAMLRARRGDVAERTVGLFCERFPHVSARYADAGRVRCFDDTLYHVSYLAEAVAAESPRLFEDYVTWAAVMLRARGLPAEDLAGNLDCLRAALVEVVPAEPGRVACRYVDGALASLPVAPPVPACFVSATAPLGPLAEAYLRALLTGARHQAADLVLRAFENGTPLTDLYTRVFVPVQHEIGRLWQLNQISVAQEHYCTAATQLIISQFYPHVFRTPRNGRRLVAAAVQGELHELGIRVVSDIFELNGWSTFYLGANTPVRAIVDACRTEGADVLAVSATITPHVSAVREIVMAARAGAGDRLRCVIVGGHPFNVERELWRRVGADAGAAEPNAALSFCNDVWNRL